MTTTPDQLAHLTKLKRIKQTELADIDEQWQEACLSVYEGYRLTAGEIGIIANVSRARIQQVLEIQKLKRAQLQQAEAAGE